MALNISKNLSLYTLPSSLIQKGKGNGIYRTFTILFRHEVTTVRRKNKFKKNLRAMWF